MNRILWVLMMALLSACSPSNNSVTPNNSALRTPTPTPMPEVTVSPTPIVSAQAAYTVAFFYDGNVINQGPSVTFECLNVKTSAVSQFKVSILSTSTGTSASNLITHHILKPKNCDLTGKVMIENVAPNGVIDGIAFGIFGTDDQEQYQIYRSEDTARSTKAKYIGAWPLQISDQAFLDKMVGDLSPSSKQEIQMALMGAEMLLNGTYQLNFNFPGGSPK